MNLLKFSALCVALVSALTGCSMFDKVMDSGKVDYKAQAKRTPRLDLPPDLTLPQQTDRFAVPDSGGKGTATMSAYNADRTNTGGVVQPQSSGVLPQVDKMRIERAGSQRWLVVNASPDDLWPQVKEFWQETGFLIDIEQPEAGVMETDWNENRAKLPNDIIRNTIGRLIDQLYSTPERDKFRTRLEPGAEPGTTEIYVSHRGVVEVYTNERSDNTVWQPRPADPELEAEMLRRLMVRLGADNERAKVLLAAQPVAERAQLVSADKGSTLQVYEGFDRAWRRVGLALDRVGFTVEDRDRSQGVYFVRYVDPEVDATGKKDGGILSKLLFFMPDDKPDPKAGQSQYRILVKGEGKQSSVQVLTREGGLDDTRTAKRILSLLHEQLK
ncbi:MAG: outer membrane protein assembly factor BamC [Methyloversatilis discipulorum]|jgi:outer membrane protein assembly factor BamC|uniref:outer membrane protein assembly factor BamC n=1 Tax=Methyloversatilis TaxID=378210 RepID=UPI000361F290|nr:outer membrane protein assembly factor BamC [Methyloversatilis discipulorum]MBT9517966.1 outer membrane protein assembly factor BamC [Methyloversatilis discipulorum]MBV5288147.1 outer membrane protein assembly factor BamC [Methyloversatilis discipulorum]PZU53218.1 MAG: outer membrane protein assembly factor BamC [Thauera sp.]